MNLPELIDKLSNLYRSSRAETNKLVSEQRCLEQELFYAKQNDFENVTHSKFEQMTLRLNVLKSQIKESEKYSEGIFDAREILLNTK